MTTLVRLYYACHASSVGNIKQLYDMFLNFRHLLIVSNNNLFRTSEKITDEKKTDEDWGMIMDFCDRVQATKDGPRDCLKSIMKQLNHTNPHVQLKAITVMNINQCFLKPTKHY